MNKKLASILAIALCLSSCGSTGTDTSSQAETTTTTTAETTTTTTAATTTAETTTTTSATTTTAPETTTTAETTTTHKTFDLPDISSLKPVDKGKLGSDIHVVTINQAIASEMQCGVSAYKLFCTDGEILAFINYANSVTTLVSPLSDGGYNVEMHRYQQGEENDASIIGYGELVTEDTIYPSDNPVPTLKTTTTSDTDILLYDANGVKLTFLGMEKGSLGIDFKVLIENDSGIDYMFQTRDVYINGMGAYLTFSSKVISGKKAKDEMTLQNSDMEDNGFTMENIETLEFKLHVFQYDDWDNSFDSEPIIIQF